MIKNKKGEIMPPKNPFLEKPDQPVFSRKMKKQTLFLITTIFIGLVLTSFVIYWLIKTDNIPDIIKDQMMPQSTPPPQTAPSPDIPSATGGGGGGGGGSGGGAGGGSGGSGPVTTPTYDLEILNPINATYYYHVTEINYKVSIQELESCYYTLNNGITNTSFTCRQPITNITSVEGENNWSIYVKYKSGIKNQSHASFFVNISPLLGSHTFTAAADDTFLLTGVNLDNSEIYISDDNINFIQTNALIDNNNNIMNDWEKILSLVPPSMNPGTLWVYIINNKGKTSNKITINNPDLWWVQPDRLDIGEETRIFGRNLDSNTGNTGQSITVKLNNSQNTYTISGTVTEPNVISFSTTETSYGDYKLWVKEPKTNDWYGPLNITIREKYQKPSYTINVVDDFNADPTGNTPSNGAFIAAFKDIDSHEGGTLYIPNGNYWINQSPLGYGPAGIYLPSAGLYYDGNYHIQGESAENTIINFNFSAPEKGAARLMVIRSNSSISDLTLKVSSNTLSLNENNVILSVGGENALAENLIIDTDESRLDRISPISIGGKYNKLKDIKVYSERNIRFDGKQNHIDNVTHYGMREIEHYNYTGNWQWSRGIGGPGFSTTGGPNQFILENSNVISRWGETPEADWNGVNRGHVKRFFGSNTNFGPIRHVYFGNNYGNVAGMPWSDAENFFVEASCRTFYYDTSLGVDKYNKRILYLKYPVRGLYKLYQYQEKAPIMVAITQGTGYGQIRSGFILQDNKTVVLDREFDMEPDHTSKILFQPNSFELIVYGNSFNTLHKYASGGVGIYWYGRSTSNIVKNNYVNGFNQGIMKMSFGCGEGASQASYFHEYIGNTINNSMAGLGNSVGGIDNDPVLSFGSLFRNNKLTNMNIDKPYYTQLPRYSAMGIATSSANADPGKTNIASIYEKNTVINAREGFTTHRSYADWLVLRKNNFYNITTKAIQIHDSIDSLYEKENNINTLPQIKVYQPDSEVRTNCEIEVMRDIYEEIPLHCNVWSMFNTSYIIFNITDDQDTIQSVTASSNAQVSHLQGDFYNLSWNLEPGLHEVKLYVSDGKETREKLFYLFIGMYDAFDDVLNITYYGNGFIVDSVSRLNMPAYYSFDQNTGTQVLDDSGVENHGTAQGNINWISNTYDSGGFDFDGIDDHLILPGAYDLFPDSNSWSISLWFNADSIGNDESGLISLMRQSYHGTIWIYLDENNKLRFRAVNLNMNQTRLTIDENIQTGNWYHVVVSYNGSNYKTYLNSVETNESVGTIYPFAGSGPTRIGTYSYFNAPANYFDGKIDEVAFFDIPLSETDIQKIYNFKIDKDYFNLGFKTYQTNTTIAFNEIKIINAVNESVIEYTDDHNHTVNKNMLIYTTREEVSVKDLTMSDPNLYDNAVISFFKDNYACYGTYVKVRLKQDDNNYYEFYDDCGNGNDAHYEPYSNPRQIRKIVNGDTENPVLKSEILAAHNADSTFVFQKQGTNLKAMTNDGTLELIDNSPLQIKDWEILVAGRPKIGDTYLETYVYSRIDNLYFAKGDSISTSLQSQAQYSPKVEIEVKQESFLQKILSFFGFVVQDISDMTGKVVDIVFKK